VAWSTSRWGRALLWMMSIVLVFLLSALAAYFAGSLVNKEPPPTSDRGPTAVDETTQPPRTENKPEPKTEQKSTKQSPPEQSPPKSPTKDSPTNQYD
jgi:cytoskeletal protein RodZ